MSVQAPLNNDPVNVITSKENLFIIRNFGSKRGGRTLDTSGYPLNEIHGSHIVIREKSTDNYKPMPLNSNNDGYGSLPADHEYVGFVIATELTKKPFVGIMTNGIVNPAASHFPIDSSLLSDLESALKHIEFNED